MLPHLLLCLWSGPDSTSRLPAQIHWLANTSGRPENHVQNFLEDMSVVYVSGHQYPRPLVLTKSFWDEGHAPNAAYHQGNRIDKNWWPDSTDSRTARSPVDTCRIRNFYGRAFLYKLSPAPRQGDSVPYIACSDSTTIRTVEDPTAIAFDRQGRLLVADNGPDQDVKIFQRQGSRWSLLRTFGTKGGVFAGPVRGAYGDRRFWGIRGLGVDSAGNVYVGNTGIPMQTMGGTDIRVFSARDSSLLWQVQGLSFVNSADAQVGSDGTSIHLNAKRFSMDWSQPPGRSWKLAGVTLDPFRFPDDIRLQSPTESVWMRRIGGKDFLFASPMRAGYVAVFRFLPGEEIASPCAVFFAGTRSVDHWMDTLLVPVTSSTPLVRRAAWQDDNGDGRVQRAELASFDVAYPYIKGIDVADDGTIRFGGRGITVIPCLGLDANGSLRWDLGNIRKERVPFTEGNGDAFRLRYFKEQDRMLIAGGATEFPSFLQVYEHWTDSARRSSRRIEIPFRDSGSGIIPRLDVNTYDMLLPAGMAADTEYAYIAYVDRGPSTLCIDVEGTRGAKGSIMKCRGEIAVFELATGKRMGSLAPDSSVAWYAGATDLNHPINVVVRGDGERIVLAEEDGKGKIFAYRWCPPGHACGPSGTNPRRTLARPRCILEGNLLRIEGLAPGTTTHLRLRDPRGRILSNAATDGPTALLSRPTGRGVFVVEWTLEGSSGRLVTALP